MSIQHEILSFNPTTGSILVRYFTEAVPEGLRYNVDIPIVDGVFASQEEVEALIEHMAPVGQLERVAVTKQAEVPNYLQAYVPVAVGNGEPVISKEVAL